MTGHFNQSHVEGRRIETDKVLVGQEVVVTHIGQDRGLSGHVDGLDSTLSLV